MNRKAFTLVELLAVIVILGILSTFLVPSIFKMVKNAKENSFNVLVESFEENARVYTSRHRDEIESYLDQYNFYSLTLNDLKIDNLLKTPISDPRTDINIDLNKKIYIVRETDRTLSVCFEDRGCFAPIKLVDKVTDPSNVVATTVPGLHQDVSNNFYYYSGSNPNNWIEFNGLLWRIVKINGDSSIKIIYEGTKSGTTTEQDGAISNGTFDNLNVNDFNNSITIKTTLQNWYDNNIDANNKAKVLPVQWCIGKIAYNSSGVAKASFLGSECSTKTTAATSIGLLSGSEYLYASLDSSCLTSYKTTGDFGYTCKNQNYLYKNTYNYWTMTPDNTATNVWTVTSAGSLGAPVAASTSNHIRPVVTLKSDVYIDRGNGTFDTPYVLKDIISVDKINPTITLLGNNSVVIKQGTSFTDLGATATDNVDGNITNKIIKISDLNVNLPGKYTITYVVSDISGNRTSINRQVEVQSFDNYGLILWLDGNDFKNSPPTAQWNDKSVNKYATTPTNFAYTTASGSDGNDGIVFDGVNDKVLTPTITTGNVDWTIVMWVKTSATDTRYLFTNTSGGPVYNALMVTSSTIAYSYYNAGWTTSNGVINIVDNKWHMLTWVNHGLGQMDLYVDRAKDSTIANASLTVGSTGPINVIGSYWGGTSFVGSLSDIRMYNRILSEEEIGRLYETK